MTSSFKIVMYVAAVASLVAWSSRAVAESHIRIERLRGLNSEKYVPFVSINGEPGLPVPFGAPLVFPVPIGSHTIHFQTLLRGDSASVVKRWSEFVTVGENETVTVTIRWQPGILSGSHVSDLSRTRSDLSEPVANVTVDQSAPSASVSPSSAAPAVLETTKARLADGSFYEGEVRSGVPHGQGQTAFANGILHRGRYVDGQLLGPGVMTFASGVTVEGDFVGWRFPERYLIKFPNGVVYNGQVRSGGTKNLLELTGFGSLRYADGSIADGFFADGKLVGTGKLSLPNGIRHEGVFDKGNFKSGAVHFPSGNVQRGTFLDGTLNGPGQIEFANGVVLRANFLRGSSDVGTLVFKDGSAAPAEFVGGVWRVRRSPQAAVAESAPQSSLSGLGAILEALNAGVQAQYGGTTVTMPDFPESKNCTVRPTHLSTGLMNQTFEVRCR